MPGFTKKESPDVQMVAQFSASIPTVQGAVAKFAKSKVPLPELDHMDDKRPPGSGTADNCGSFSQPAQKSDWKE